MVFQGSGRSNWGRSKNDSPSCTHRSCLDSLRLPAQSQQSTCLPWGHVYMQSAQPPQAFGYIGSGYPWFSELQAVSIAPSSLQKRYQVAPQGHRANKWLNSDWTSSDLWDLKVLPWDKSPMFLRKGMEALGPPVANEDSCLAHICLVHFCSLRSSLLP